MAPDLIELTQSDGLDLFPSAPFHFDGTFHKPSFFPSGEDSRAYWWQPGVFWQALRVDGEVIGARLEDAGTPDAPRLRLTAYSRSPLSPGFLARLAGELEFRFALHLDLGEFLALAEADDLLRPAARRWRGMRPFGGSLYENLMIYIVLQNATVRRTVQMMDNLMGVFGQPVSFDSQRLHAYWRPEEMAQTPEEDLRALKVGYRARMFRRVSAQVAAGEANETELRGCPNAELRQRLLRLFGIGPASVWYLMFEVFHRYDALDHISPWEQQIYSRLMFERELAPVEEIIAEAGRRWGRWKMLAAHYLFEDLFWQRRNQPLPWLEALIRL